MALYREEDPNKLPSINSLSIDDVISGNIKPSTAVSNITPSVNTVPTTTQNVSQPSSQQSTVNKNVNLPSINEVSLDDIVQTPPKVPQVQQTQQIQQQGITWKETLKYLPGQFTIDNLKKTIPQAIVSTFKGGAKEIAKFLVDVADVALDITPKNFKEKNKLVLDKWRDNLKLEPTEVPGAIAAQIGEVIVGIGVTKEVLTKVPTISKFAKAFPKTFNVVNSGITGATIGQIGMDNEATFKDRVKQAAIDFPTWVAFSATGGIPAKKYYAYLPSYFATGYLSSKLEGADHQDALVSGLMTAAIGGGLHAISKPQQETINKMRQAQLEEANRTLAQYGVYDKTSYLNAMHKYHPDVSKLPEEKAQKITTAINTAWTIKNNPPQAVERSLMQEINDLINVIKSPDKAKAMENIGKTTPPIALIPEQITPEGEVKPTLEPTAGPVKAPTEIKPTPVEKAPTAPTVIEAPPAELTAKEITPTKQPETPEVSVVKPPTIETTPTETTPSPEIPTGATAQPTIAKAPVVKVPEQPAITPEAETEVKIPEIKPKEVAKPVVGTKIVPKELEPLAKEARKYKSAEEFKKALGKTQGVLWSGRKGGITDLSKPLFTSENPNLALTYSLNYPENLELAEKDLQAFIPKDGKTLDLTTNKKAIQYLKKIGIDVKEGYSVRQTVYNNWNKIINEAKKDGYDYINHIGEDEFAQFLDIETVVLNPQKSLQSLTDFYNQVVKEVKEKIPEKKVGKETKVAKSIEAKAKEETLAFNPENLSNPKSEKAKAEVDKIVKRSEIAKELSEKLDVTIRRGKFRQKALGIYKKHGKIIRIKGGQMLTVSHEIGHYLDDVLEDFSSKINPNETDNLIKDYSKSIQNKSESEKQAEAFGEFIRFWITEPNKATSRAPEFSKYFNERLEKYPEVKEVLETARRDYKRWTEMPATSKVLSQVSIGETEQSKTIKEKFTDFYVAAKDDLYPLKQYADLLKDKKIPVEENPYILARLTRGWQDKADLFLTTGTFGKNYYKVDAKGKNKIVFKGKGLRQILQPVEKAKAMDDLIAYLTSQETINGAKTGIAKEDAEEAIKEITQRHPEMPKWAGEVYRYDRHLLEYLYEYGMIDKELFNKLKEIHSTHVPLYRVFDEIAKNGYLGKGMVNLSNQIKKRVGSERDIINPIEGLIKNTYLIINAVDRNNVGVAMANLAAADDRTARLFEKVPTPMAKVATVTAKELGIKLEDLSDEDAEKVFNIFRPSIFTPNDNTVSVLIKGKKHFYQTTPEIYNALTTTSRESANMIINFLSYPTKWLRAGATLNPDFFIAKNPIRDQLTAFVYSKYGFIPGVDFIRGLYTMVGKKDEYYLAKASGAFHTMFVSMDRKYLQKSFDDIVKEHNFTDYLKNPMEALRALSEYSEIPTRLGEFIKALDKTKNPIEAAFAFREVTLDFGKQGTVGKTLNQVIAFWNAWAEGWDKLVRQFKERPLQTSWKVVLGITIPSIIFYLLNKDDPRWDEIPQWQKDSFWIIMFPNKIIRIAKPFEVGMLFGSTPERILDSINTDDPQALKDLANNLIFGQSPGFIPTAIEPLIENWTNYSFFLQRPIVSESKEALPPEFQYNQYTSETAKKLGELLNYPPAKIDNLFQGYFGGLGKYATQAVDKVLTGTGISPNIPQPSPTLADIPIAKAFIVRNPIGSASKSVDRFYEQYDKFNAGERALKKMIENNEREKYFKFKEQHPELLFTYDYSTDTFYSPPARFLRQTATTLSEIRKIEQEVYNSETMTPQEKREKIDALDAIITETANQALEVLKKNGVY